MRKVVLTGLVTAVAFAVVATPASAFFDPEFSVTSETTSYHPTSNGFRFGDKLFDVFNDDNGVGRDRGVCVDTGGGKVKCRARVKLNGEVGGYGTIKLNGNLGRGDNRINVVGGTHSFNGAAGKVLIHGLGRHESVLEFHLTK